MMSSSLLHQIISGNEISRSISVQDTVEHSGGSLLKCITQELALRVDEIHLFAFDVPANTALRGHGTDLQISQKIIYHDGWTDPHGWKSDSLSGSGHNMVHFTSEKDLVDHVRDNKRRESRIVGVVIDSLTPLIINRSAALTCKSLHSLTIQQSASDFQVSQVVGLLHADVHDEAVLRMIGHQCSTVISVAPSTSTMMSERELTGYADVLHKKPSGKVLRKREGYSITSDWRLHTFSGLPKTEETMESDNAQPDPTANLTFNLTLTESEKRARENVVLPFTQVSENCKSGTGQIFYEPDKDDDYDDEDPDDDLDI